MPYSEDRRTWTDEIPMLHDLMQFGGVPGRIYAFVGSSREMECNQNGWHRVSNFDEQGNRTDSGVFKLIGPKGEATFCILETGDLIQGASPHGGARELFIDPSLLTATGLRLPDDDPDPDTDTDPDTDPDIPPTALPASKPSADRPAREAR